MELRLADRPALDLECDVLVVPELEADEPSDLGRAVDARLGGRLARARALKDLSGKHAETFWLYSEGSVPAPRVLVVGIGKRDELTPERVRRAAGTAVRQLKRREVKRAAVALQFERDGQSLWIIRALADGIVTGDFEGGLYKSDRKERPLGEIVLGVVEGTPPADWAEPLRQGIATGQGVNLARALAVEPGGHLTPLGLAERARAVGQATGLEVEVIEGERLCELGAGALLGVARGSDEPPCLIVMRYRAGHEGGPVLALVGKGVTFDSGGISIKPAGNMHEMKFDMSGAAATIGAMQTIAALKPSIDVLGVVPATENLPSGRSMKPGDVLTAMNGKTIEVLNTDAEGRLILADALVYAQRQGATHLIDAATLTGAIVTALGHHATGLFATPDDWLERVRRVAERAGDRVWPMPLFPEYREQLKSEVADIANIGGRAGGACTAAAFIQEFVEGGRPWAHLDIAGTAYTSGEKPHQVSGPTGAATRLFVELALDLALTSPHSPDAETRGRGDAEDPVPIATPSP
ncbi:MAG TPA: leucyl aminopeptidase [Chloroflexota bacterium]|jgi:leucyl aminopeptidase